MIRVVVGAPVAERAWILPDWFQAVRANATADIEIKTVMLYTESKDETWGLVENLSDDILVDRFLKTRDPQRIAQHLWSEEEGEYAYLANLRNNLVRHVSETDADLFFSLDTDILIPPGTIEQLVNNIPIYAEPWAVSPMVDLSKDHDFTAWNFMRWGDPTKSRGTRFPPPSEMDPFHADILMAAILMNRGAMAARWGSDPQGEDIGWARSADDFHVVRGVLKIQCEHVMNPAHHEARDRRDRGVVPDA